MDAPTPRVLLERILDAPHLARAVPALPAEVLHRLIQHCGLEESGDLLALATPDQLSQVFDHDLWSIGARRGDPQFDPERFGLWLEVMVQSGVETAASTIAGIDVELVTTALAQHVRVFDYAAVAPYISLDGEEVRSRIAYEDRQHCEIGGYLVVARRAGWWDAIVALMAALGESHGEYFTQVMRGCVAQSDSAPEIDGLDDVLTARDQSMFDIEMEREQRLDAQGYVTPAQARAFLEGARRVDVRHGTACPGSDVARAYFRRVESLPADVPAHTAAAALIDAPSHRDDAASTSDVAAIIDVLVEAGVVPQGPRALLAAPETASQPRDHLQEHLQFVHDADPVMHATRSAELAFLANALMVGSSLQSRTFAAAEASAAVAAVCNLGLENWPARWLQDTDRRQSHTNNRGAMPIDLLLHHDLIDLFQVGWTVLHENVGMRAAERLLGALTGLEFHDPITRSEIDALLAMLTKAWRAGAPWRIGDALEAIATLDLPAWIALVGLLGECPVMHAAVTASVDGETHAIDSSTFTFIATNDDIAAIDRFLQLLPVRLHE